MDLYHFIIFCGILVLIPIVAAIAVYSHRARQWFLCLMVFSTVFIYHLQVVFFGRIWYRGTSRGYEVSIIDILAVGLIAGTLIRPRRGQGKLFWPAGLLPLFIYLFYCTVSTFFADPSIFGWWEVWKIIRGIVVIVAVAWYIRTEKELGMLVLAIAVTVCFEGLWSLKLRYVDREFRIFGTLDHPNSLSMYLCMVAPVLYAGCLTRNMPVWTKRLCLVGTGFAMVGVILTISRAGFVDWCVVMLGMTLACVSPRLTMKKAMIALASVLCVAGAIGYSWKTIEKRLVEETNFQEEMDPNNLGRGSYLRLAKLIVSERFWGVGLNNWSWAVTNEYQEKDNPKLKYKPYLNTEDFPDLIPVYTPTSKMETAQAAPAHNLGALTIGELGWVGLILFAFVWLRWFDMGQRFLWKRSPEMMHRMGTGMFFAVCAVFLQSMTEWEYRQPPIYYMFHILLGALAALYRIRRLSRKAVSRAAAPVMPTRAQPAY